ncbi:MAG: glycosyltransferase, partial [Anaerolineae bacterium]
VHEGARRHPAGAVRFLGPVKSEDLPALYRGAAAVVHPALDEGFGMTVAEAMAVGAPTVASRAGSLPEVAGEAALLVPPTDPDAWAEAILRVVHDSALAEDLSARGRERASGLTVEAMAAATLKVYREAAP